MERTANRELEGTAREVRKRLAAVIESIGP
jgi:hypothetical protein